MKSLRIVAVVVSAMVGLDLLIFLLSDGKTPWAGDRRADPEFQAYWLCSLGILATLSAFRWLSGRHRSAP